jgi:DNA polymerase-4
MSGEGRAATTGGPLPALCRDCLTRFEAAAPRQRCPACGSPRTLAHAELGALAIAHVDCDAFYAAVEKRDDPSLADRPVIVGGGRRGVVATCCYVARIRGVRSAMPMFKALALCPDAVVIRPRMGVYAEVSRAIRTLMEALTPLVEPLSLDEAFLDLSGSERLHGAPPAVTLARLQARIAAETGVTVSIGLSHNKFLAKLASELDKPRGFSVIGRAETDAFLARRPVSAIWGVGRALAASLAADGIDTVADLRRFDRAALIARHGAMGARLHDLARGVDARAVSPDRAPKSVSAETTFDDDVADAARLEAALWALAVRVADRLKAKGLAGRTATLKLKRADFRLLTRRAALPEPVQLADALFRAARPLLARDLGAGPFRLIGVGLGDLATAGPDPAGDLLDPAAGRRARAERATDAIRARFGPGAIRKGRGLGL